jgi:hypothetical protein
MVEEAAKKAALAVGVGAVEHQAGTFRFRPDESGDRRFRVFFETGRLCVGVVALLATTPTKFSA